MRKRLNVLAVEPEFQDIDLTDSEQRAHAISGALSTIDLVEIEPAEFWAVFGSKDLKPATLAWLKNSLRKLEAFKAGA
jgi:hypothetical protein